MTNEISNRIESEAHSFTGSNATNLDVRQLYRDMPAQTPGKTTSDVLKSDGSIDFGHLYGGEHLVSALSSEGRRNLSFGVKLVDAANDNGLLIQPLLNQERTAAEFLDVPWHATGDRAEQKDGDRDVLMYSKDAQDVGRYYMAQHRQRYASRVDSWLSQSQDGPPWGPDGPIINPDIGDLPAPYGQGPPFPDRGKTSVAPGEIEVQGVSSIVSSIEEKGVVPPDNPNRPEKTTQPMPEIWEKLPNGVYQSVQQAYDPSLNGSIYQKGADGSLKINETLSFDPYSEYHAWSSMDNPGGDHGPENQLYYRSTDGNLKPLQATMSAHEAPNDGHHPKGYWYDLSYDAPKDMAFVRQEFTQGDGTASDAPKLLEKVLVNGRIISHREAEAQGILYGGGDGSSTAGGGDPGGDHQPPIQPPDGGCGTGDLSPDEMAAIIMRDFNDALTRALQLDGSLSNPQFWQDFWSTLWSDLQRDIGGGGNPGGEVLPPNSGSDNPPSGHGGDHPPPNSGGDNSTHPKPGEGKPGDASDLYKLIQTDSSVSPSDLNQVEKALQNVPEPVRQALRDLKPEIIITNHMSVEGAAAYWDPASNQVVIGAGTGMVQEAASHEFWHVADTRFGITDDPGFRQAAAKDLQNGALDKIGRAAGVLADPPEVNGTAVGDAFAEVGVDIDRFYGGDDDQTGIAGAMGNGFANMEAWMRNWVSQHGG